MYIHLSNWSENKLDLESQSTVWVCLFSLSLQLPAPKIDGMQEVPKYSSVVLSCFHCTYVRACVSI